MYALRLLCIFSRRLVFIEYTLPSYYNIGVLKMFDNLIVSVPTCSRITLIESCFFFIIYLQTCNYYIEFTVVGPYNKKIIKYGLYCFCKYFSNLLFSTATQRCVKNFQRLCELLGISENI